MSQEVLTSLGSLGSKNKPLVLFRGEYSQWKDRFLDHIAEDAQGKDLLRSITKGPVYPILIPRDDGTHTEKEFAKYSEEERTKHENDFRARRILLHALPNDIYSTIDSCKTAKAMWDALEKQMLVSEKGRQLQKANCYNAFNNFCQMEGEPLYDTYTRFLKVLNDLIKAGVPEKENIEINQKFLDNLLPEYDSFAVNINSNVDLHEFDIHQVFGKLIQDQTRVNARKKHSSHITTQYSSDPLALMSSNKSVFQLPHTSSPIPIINSPLPDTLASEEPHSDPDMEDMRQAISLLTRQFNSKYYNKSSSNQSRSSTSRNTPRNDSQRSSGQREEYKRDSAPQGNYQKNDTRDGQPREVFNLREAAKVPAQKEEKKMENSVKCYNCGGFGHLQRNCPRPRKRTPEYYRQRLLLAQAQEENKALVVEDEAWANYPTDDEEDAEGGDQAYFSLCLMAYGYDSSDSDDEDSAPTPEVDKKFSTISCTTTN